MRAKGLWPLSLPKQCALHNLGGLCMSTRMSISCLEQPNAATILCVYLCTYIA